MKRNPVLCLLLFVLTLTTVHAQSGRNRTDEGDPKKASQRQETPAPTPAPPAIGADKNAADAGGDDAVLKISTDLVSFPVSVFDRKGRYIFDLKREEFEVFEDGKPQELAFFANTEQPFTVVLMLDISLSTKFQITDIQRAAIAFVNQLRPQDKVMIVAFAEEVYVLSEFTGDREQLKRAIRTTRFKDGTSLYDAFDFAISQRLQKVTGRKAIVLFTDGVDTTSKRSYLGENLRAADELDALIFPIKYDTYADVKRMERQGTVTVPEKGPQTGGPLPLPQVIIDDDDRNRPNNDPNGKQEEESKSPGTSAKDYKVADDYLAALADRTGGRVEKADTLYDLEGAFGRIAQELRQQYSIGYYPPDIEKTGTPRKIKVKVTRPNLVVKARDTYTIGTPAKKKKRKSG
jgi:VWFA-related protein